MVTLHERHVLYLDSPETSEFGWQYIDQYIADHQCKNRSEAVEELFREHQQLIEQHLDNEHFVEQITTEVKQLLDPIRLRTGATERNVAVFRELLNGFLVLHGMEEQFPVMDVQSDAILRADEKVSDQIKALQVYRSSNKYKHTNGGD